jgi:hypothetical protein
MSAKCDGSENPHHSMTETPRGGCPDTLSLVCHPGAVLEPRLPQPVDLVALRALRELET